MAEKVLRLNPNRGFYMGGGLHFANPEKSFIRLPDSYVPHKEILQAIATKALIDVNNNIATAPAAKAPVVKEAPVVKATPAEAPQEDAKVAVKETPKASPKTKQKS